MKLLELVVILHSFQPAFATGVPVARFLFVLRWKLAGHSQLFFRSGGAVLLDLRSSTAARTSLGFRRDA
jgi:hypothetical protein